jgi:hypothetical protein
MFLLSKSVGHYYDADAIGEPASGENEHDLTGRYRDVPEQPPHGTRKLRTAVNVRPIKGARHDPFGQGTKVGLLAVADEEYAPRNRRSLWTAGRLWEDGSIVVFPSPAPRSLELDSR